jgi:hypothetical protein
MTEEQFKAFEEHCRASETYKYLKIDMQAQEEKWLNEWRPTGEMALEDFERFERFRLERFLDERDRYRTIRVKGYNPGDTMKDLVKVDNDMDLIEALEKRFSLHDVDMIYNVLQQFYDIDTKQGEITFLDFINKDY